MAILPIVALLLVLFLIGWASYSIGQVVYRSVGKAENPYAGLLRAVTVLGSFALIVGLIILFFAYNFRLER